MDHRYDRGGQLIRPGQTIGEALQSASARLAGADIAFGHGAVTAIDEAAFLILEGLGLPIDDLESVVDRQLSDGEAASLSKLVEDRARDRIPAAYLVGAAYIGPYRFVADARALVPRSFIGELLAAGIGETDPLPLVEETSTRRILDLCAGSASLAILAAHAFPGARVDAADISADAIALAGVNVREHGLTDRVRLFVGDLFAPLGRDRFDLIITNPPYVKDGVLEDLPEEYGKEPRLGLAGGPDGLGIVRRILAEAPAHLASEGVLICEIGGGRSEFERHYPDLDVLWLDTEESTGEVFRVDAAALSAHNARQQVRRSADDDR